MSLTAVEKDIKKTLEKAIRAAKKADTLAEEACMAAMDAYNMLRHDQITPRGEAVRDRSNRAHDEGGDARAALGGMVHELEQAITRI